MICIKVTNTSSNSWIHLASLLVNRTGKFWHNEKGEKEKCKNNTTHPKHSLFRIEVISFYLHEQYSNASIAARTGIRDWPLGSLQENRRSWNFSPFCLWCSFLYMSFGYNVPYIPIMYSGKINKFKKNGKLSFKGALWEEHIIWSEMKVYIWSLLLGQKTKF